MALVPSPAGRWRKMLLCKRYDSSADALTTLPPTPCRRRLPCSFIVDHGGSTEEFRDGLRYGVSAVTGGAVMEDTDLQTLQFFRRRPYDSSADALATLPPTPCRRRLSCSFTVDHGGSTEENRDGLRYGVSAVTGGAVAEDAVVQALRFFRRRPYDSSADALSSAVTLPIYRRSRGIDGRKQRRLALWR